MSVSPSERCSAVPTQTPRASPPIRVGTAHAIEFVETASVVRVRLCREDGETP